MDAEMRVIGHAVRDVAAFDRVTGRAKFSSDFQLPGMLHAKLVKSPYARANIINVDTSAAEAVPGVKLVMTKDNFPFLFLPSVSFVGADVACVVATDICTAEKARALIKVEYEELPAVIDPYKAREEGAPLVMPDIPMNVLPWQHVHYSEPDENGCFTKRGPGEFDGYGDLDEAKKEVDVFVRGDGFTYGKAQAPLMALSGSVADFKDGNLRVYLPTQHPSQARYILSQVFQIPLHKVNVIAVVTGGGFGGRLGMGLMSPSNDVTYTMIAAAASVALGVPVRLVYTREEEFIYYWGRSGMDTRTEIGFRTDGTIATMDTEVWRNVSTGGVVGVGTQLFDSTATGNMLYSHNCKANKFVKKAVLTNGPAFVGWQGFGNPEVFFAVESTMDMAAERLNLDPVELRRRNHACAGDNWLSLCYRHTGSQWLGHTGFDACLDEGLKRVPWSERKPASEKAGTVRPGIGMSLHCQQNGGEGLKSRAIVKLQSDGTATLLCNYQDLGQGGRTAQVQIVAELLGLTADRVNVVADETDYTPYTHYQSCSSGTVIQSPATYQACMDAKRQLLEEAAKMMGVPAEDLETRDGMIFPKDTLSHLQCARGCEDTASPIPWTAVFNQGAYEWVAQYDSIIGQGVFVKPAGPMPAEQGATFAELDVDTETGELKNIKITVVQDCGRAINRRAVEGCYLGVHHGLEAVVCAEQVLDSKTGKLLNDSYIDYPVASILDYRVEPVIVEKPDPSNPIGATGIGQAYQNGLAAAVGNAIYNAIGVRMKETPFTPTRILQALGKL